MGELKIDQSAPLPLATRQGFIRDPHERDIETSAVHSDIAGAIVSGHTEAPSIIRSNMRTSLEM